MASFKSLAEAKVSLLELILDQYDFITMDRSRRSAYNTKLDQWSLAFEAFIAFKSSSLSIIDQRIIRLLRLHRKSIVINTSRTKALIHNIMSWDEFTDEFNGMVIDAALIMGLEDKLDEFPSLESRFYLTTILGSIVRKCRDPLIRRKAIWLMMMAPVQEGVWSSALTVRISRRTVAIEESGRDVKDPTDIPEEARVLAVRVCLGPGDTQVTARYTLTHGWHEETLMWQ